MLKTVKQCIEDLPEKQFEVYYQEYVQSIQDKIILHDIHIASHDYTSIEDMCQLIAGLNTLTEELKIQ